MQEDQILRDIDIIRLALDEKAFYNFEKLATLIIRCMQATNPTLIESPHFEHGTVWAISLPIIGLQLRTRKAILLLRQKEEKSAAYKYLLEIQDDKDAEFIIVIDIAHINSFTLRVTPRIVWFSPSSLIEMVTTSKEDLPRWLGRYIATQIDFLQPLLPYKTHGVTELFFGRDHELMRLISRDPYGGIIIGAHRSGKTSLLHQLGMKLRQRDLTVVGPITFAGTNSFQSFFERTLDPLSIDYTAEITAELWSSSLRTYHGRVGEKPIFLLDEVDGLISLDVKSGLLLGQQMRALQSDGYCEFYLAGHGKLREAIELEGSPFRNFAEEIILTGLSQTSSVNLIQEPMKLLGFFVNDDQAMRIFKGTAGVAVLIQEFCIRLLDAHIRQSNKPEIDDALIEEVERFPDYLNEVFHHYEYGQNWISTSIMLITAILEKVTREDIVLEFGKRGTKISWDQLDKALNFLIKFGTLEEFQGGYYKIASTYLRLGIMIRNPYSMLDASIEKSKKGK